MATLQTCPACLRDIGKDRDKYENYTKKKGLTAEEALFAINPCPCSRVVFIYQVPVDQMTLDCSSTAAATAVSSTNGSSRRDLPDLD